MTCVIFVNNIPEFYKFWDEFNHKYGNYIVEKIFSVYIQLIEYNRNYLVPDEFKKIDRDKYATVGSGGKVDIDEIDYKLLNEISINAKIPLIELSNKLKISSQSVNYRIKNLTKKSVIQGYRIGINDLKIGYEHFKVDFFLNNPSQRRGLMNYIKYIPNVTFINTSAGYADFEMEIVIENSNKLIELIENIYIKFPNLIKKYYYYSAKKIYRFRSLPEMEFK